MESIKIQDLIGQSQSYTLKLNLQFFADGPGGEKTEEATPKKLSDARKEGNVAKSSEVAVGLGLIALFLVLKFWVGNMGISLMEVFGGVYNHIPDATTMSEGTIPDGTIVGLIRDVLTRILIILAPVFLISFAVAFIGDLVQVKWAPTTKPLKPKLNKLSPQNGIKRIFSSKTLIELLKAVVKITMIAYVVYSYLKDKQEQLYMLYDMAIIPAVQFAGNLVINLGLRISLIYLVIVAFDYWYTKQKFKKDMRMTKQEVKDEYKNAEGNPEVKGKIRAKMREASQRRMMQQLPQADVVITNPTHYAVAIKYDPDTAPAPVVIAKGEDYLAKKIKEIARENNIEIVENKPLARMLYANVEVDQMVPPELYNAVAEVLAFVYHLKGKV